MGGKHVGPGTSTKAEDEPHRLNLVLDAASYEAIDAIKGRIGAASHTEVIRRALRALDYLTSLDDRGKRILVQDRDDPNALPAELIIMP